MIDVPDDKSVFTVLPSDEEWVLAEAVEAKIFADYGYTPDNYDEEYGPYRADSIFIGIHCCDEIAGVMRVIVPGASGFKTLNDAQDGARPDRLVIDDDGWRVLAAAGVERATLRPPPNMIECNIAVERRHQTASAHARSVSNRLLAAAIRYGLARAAAAYGPDAPAYALASGDSRYLRLFRWRYGPAVKRLGPPVMYLGSLTEPVLIDIRAMVGYDREKRKRLLDGGDSDTTYES